MTKNFIKLCRKKKKKKGGKQIFFIGEKKVTEMRTGKRS